VMDHTCVWLCVLRAGASSSMECQMVDICCDWCGCLSGEDGAWTLGGFGRGLCRGKTHCGERESSMKSNRVGTTGVVGLLCTLGSLAVLLVERRGDGQGDGSIVPTLGGVVGDAGSGRASGGTLGHAPGMTWVAGSAL
jgi:hypothetical protein